MNKLKKIAIISAALYSFGLVAELFFGAVACALCFIQQRIYLAMLIATIWGIFGNKKESMKCVIKLLAALLIIVASYHTAIVLGWIASPSFCKFNATFLWRTFNACNQSFLAATLSSFAAGIAILMLLL